MSGREKIVESYESETTSHSIPHKIIVRKYVVKVVVLD